MPNMLVRFNVEGEAQNSQMPLQYLVMDVWQEPAWTKGCGFLEAPGGHGLPVHHGSGASGNTMWRSLKQDQETAEGGPVLMAVGGRTAQGMLRRNQAFLPAWLPARCLPPSSLARVTQGEGP